MCFYLLPCRLEAAVLSTYCLELPLPIWRFDARRLECPTHCIAARRIPSAVLLLGAAVSCFLLPGGSNLLVLPRGAVVSGLVVLPPGGLSVQTYRLLTGGCLVSLPAA